MGYGSVEVSNVMITIQLMETDAVLAVRLRVLFTAVMLT